MTVLVTISSLSKRRYVYALYAISNLDDALVIRQIPDKYGEGSRVMDTFEASGRDIDNYHLIIHTNENALLVSHICKQKESSGFFRWASSLFSSVSMLDHFINLSDHLEPEDKVSNFDLIRMKGSLYLCILKQSGRFLIADFSHLNDKISNNLILFENQCYNFYVIRTSALSNNNLLVLHGLYGLQTVIDFQAAIHPSDSVFQQGNKHSDQFFPISCYDKTVPLLVGVSTEGSNIKAHYYPIFPLNEQFLTFFIRHSTSFLLGSLQRWILFLVRLEPKGQLKQLFHDLWVKRRQVAREVIISAIRHMEVDSWFFLASCLPCYDLYAFSHPPPFLWLVLDAISDNDFRSASLMLPVFIQISLRLQENQNDPVENLLMSKSISDTDDAISSPFFPQSEPGVFQHSPLLPGVAWCWHIVEQIIFQSLKYFLNSLVMENAEHVVDQVASIVNYSVCLRSAEGTDMQNAVFKIIRSYTSLQLCDDFNNVVNALFLYNELGRDALPREMTSNRTLKSVLDSARWFSKPTDGVFVILGDQNRDLQVAVANIISCFDRQVVLGFADVVGKELGLYPYAVTLLLIGGFDSDVKDMVEHCKDLEFVDDFQALIGNK